MEEQRSRPAHLTGLLFAVVVGLPLGALAKIADQAPIHELSQIGTQLGMWVVVLTCQGVAMSDLDDLLPGLFAAGDAGDIESFAELWEIVDVSSLREQLGEAP